jgi:ATP-dependent Lon protease
MAEKEDTAEQGAAPGENQGAHAAEPASSPGGDAAPSPPTGSEPAAPAVSLPAPSNLECLPLLPLRSDVVFPETVVPLVVGRDRGIRLVDDVMETAGKRVALVTQRSGEIEDPKQSDLHPALCVAQILKMLKFPDGTTRIVVHGETRARLQQLVESEPYLVGEVVPFEDAVEPGLETDALAHNLSSLFNQVVEHSQIPEELQVAVMNTREPGRLADLLAHQLPFTVEEKQEVLAEQNVQQRLQKLIVFLKRQLEVIELSSKIHTRVGSAINKMQREHFLREQLKAIRQELGEAGEGGEEIDELQKRIAKAKMPKDAMDQAKRELERLGQMHPSSAEYSVIRTYLDWLIELPWNKSSKDKLDIRLAAKVLDEDHYGLEKIKERILEYLAVRKLKKDMKGPILCFVGPPGTGKTSLGQSIARALGRQFYRMSLGGIRDEAEIRGHRRTYVAALPGRVIQGIHKAKTNNPVFMLDEVDKVGADFRGDPTSALLEVLDPEQNFSFRDHYLDVDFDLSKVMFIATANTLATIPPPLLDRMELLELSGYSEEEKIAIAHEHLIPKQLAEHGLAKNAVVFRDDVLREMISKYTREAGLRNLERSIASICRKVARAYAEGKGKTVKLEVSDIAEMLGPPKHFPELADRTGVAGVATGLAWTPTGGDILFIESTAMAGKKGLTLTGSLGDVMKESAQAALSYIRSHAKQLDVNPTFFDKHDLHIHVPSGAIAKDGPSAGVALVASLVSLLRNLPLPPEIAVTGEITLTGRVLPVGGIREKLLAARRAGIQTVLLPKQNEKDTIELPREVLEDLTLEFVESLDEVIARLLASPGQAGRQIAIADSDGSSVPTRRRVSAKPAAPPQPIGN